MNFQCRKNQAVKRQDETGSAWPTCQKVKNTMTIAAPQGRVGYGKLVQGLKNQ